VKTSNLSIVREFQRGTQNEAYDSCFRRLIKPEQICLKTMWNKGSQKLVQMNIVHKK